MRQLKWFCRVLRRTDNTFHSHHPSFFIITNFSFSLSLSLFSTLYPYPHSLFLMLMFLCSFLSYLSYPTLPLPYPTTLPIITIRHSTLISIPNYHLSSHLFLFYFIKLLHFLFSSKLVPIFQMKVHRFKRLKIRKS